MNESLIYFGGAVKALDENGKIGGYLVRFTDADHKDLDGEYFVKDTYLGNREGDGADTIFHHAQPLPVKVAVSAEVAAELHAMRDYVFTPVKTKRDAVGLWAETVMDLANSYEKAVFNLAKKGKIGWSSGAVSHLVRKDTDGKITRWPIGEASLTPTPADALNRAIPIKSLAGVKFVSLIDEGETPATQDESDAAIKSLITPNRAFTVKINQFIDDLIDDGRSREQIIQNLAREAWTEVDTVKAILTGQQRATDANLKAFSRVLNVAFDSLKRIVGKDPNLTIKGLFEDAVSEKGFSSWQLYDIYAKVARKLAIIAQSSQSTGVAFDLEGKLSEVNAEFIKRLNDLVLSQIADFIESDSDDNFYLKSMTAPDGNLLADLNIDLDDHSQLAVSALQGVSRRFRQNHGARVKAGRVLSDKNRTRIESLMKAMQAVMTDMQGLLDESKPMATDKEKMAAISKSLRLRARTRQLGVISNGEEAA